MHPIHRSRRKTHWMATSGNREVIESPMPRLALDGDVSTSDAIPSYLGEWPDSMTFSAPSLIHLSQAHAKRIQPTMLLNLDFIGQEGSMSYFLRIGLVTLVANS